MADTAFETAATEVIDGVAGQTLVLPANFRFHKHRVYLQRDVNTGVISVSERPFPSQESGARVRPSFEEVFKMFDDLGADDFELERDLSPPVDKDLF